MTKFWGGFLVLFALVLSTVAFLSMRKTTPRVVSLSPAQVAGIQVGCDGQTLEERVKCRIENADNDEITIMPEECRTLTSGNQEKCVDRNNNLKKCWQEPVGTARSVCAMKVLGIAKSVKTSWQECLKATDTNLRAMCKQLVREAALNLAKFRIDDLSERAIDRVQDKTLPVEKVVALVVTMEKHKVALQGATNYVAHKKTLDGVRASWRKFVTTNKLKNMSNDYLQQSYTDLAAVK